MRKEIVLPGIALAGGVGGFFLRRWELTSAFEAETGLPIPNAPAMWALLALSVVVAAVLLLLCRGDHKPFPGGYDEAFAAKGNTGYLLLMLLAAAALLASGLLAAVDLLGAYREAMQISGVTPILAMVPEVLVALLCLAGAAAVALLGKSGYSGKSKGRYSLPLLLPAYMTCLWLISAYQKRAGDPVRQDYIYELLAIIALLLGLYLIAGFSFEKAKVFGAALFSLLGVYFSLVTLADAHSMAVMLRYVFAILYLIAEVTALLYHDSPRTLPVLAEPTEGQTEVNPNEE